MVYDVGSRLKHVRELHGLSQRELARRAGVTNGLISLIEQNRVSPSVGSLKKVLDGVPLSLAEFFTLDVTSAPQVFYGADELVEIGNDGASLRLVAAQRPGRQLTVLHERYEPGAATGEEMLSHRGEEGGVVVRGAGLVSGVVHDLLPHFRSGVARSPGFTVTNGIPQGGIPQGRCEQSRPLPQPTYAPPPIRGLPRGT